MAKTVNILGDTPKEQWTSAITVYEVALLCNIRYVRDEVEDEEALHCLDVAERVAKDFADEMRRLVEGVFE